MTNHKLDAERLFTDFAKRHSLNIIKEDSDEMEVLFIVPIQDRISFELVLGLQNGDEINIGINEFWSYFFPFASVETHVARILNGLATGDIRMATYRQLGRDISRDLEELTTGVWTRVYRDVCGFKMPLVGTQVCYVRNITS